MLLNILAEAAQDPKILALLIARRASIDIDSTDNSLLLKFLGTEDGLVYLQNNKNETIENIVQNWMGHNSDLFVEKIESSLGNALNKYYLKSKINAVETIPISMPAGGSGGGSHTTTTTATTTTSNNTTTANNTTSSGSSSEEGYSRLCGQDIDLEGLLRVPWIVEAKLTSAASVPLL